MENKVKTLILLLAFFQYEYSTGINKNCVYEGAGGTYTITIKSYQLCPLTINR